MSIFLTLNLVVMIATMVFLYQTNVQQPRPQSELPLQELKMESTKNSDWLVLVGIAGVAGLMGLAVLNRKRREVLNKNWNSDEENYFG